jgi:hypothetical protein
MWANDPGYVILAGDLTPATFCGRFWSAESKAWANVSNMSPLGGTLPPKQYRLKAVDVRVVNASGGIKSGVRIMVMCVLDPRSTGIVNVVIDGLQSAHKTLNWIGNIPLEYGVQWRIHQGALVAGDIVSMSVQYE